MMVGKTPDTITWKIKPFYKIHHYKDGSFRGYEALIEVWVDGDNYHRVEEVSPGVLYTEPMWAMEAAKAYADYRMASIRTSVETWAKDRIHHLKEQLGES